MEIDEKVLEDFETEMADRYVIETHANESVLYSSAKYVYEKRFG
jgi:hypothetical protein